MVFEHSRLFGSYVDDIAGKWRRRCCGMERMLDVAEQVVNVFASDDQTALLGIVQLPRMPRTF